MAGNYQINYLIEFTPKSQFSNSVFNLRGLPIHWIWSGHRYGIDSAKIFFLKVDVK